MGAPVQPDAPVLNPFPFAAETHFRLAFLVLIAAAIALSAGYIAFAGLLTATPGGEACVVAMMRDLLPNYETVSKLDFPDALRFVEAMQACFADVPGGSLVFWPFVFLCTLGAATAVWSAFGPLLVTRRAGLRPLPQAARAVVEPRVAALAEAMGLRSRPRLLWMPLEARPRAFVFGSDRRPRLALSYGAVAEGLAAPEALETLVAHELAHIANRDVTVALLTQAVVLALVAVILPLYLVLTYLVPWAMGPPPEPTMDVGGPASTVNELLRMALAAALVWGGRNAVLRSRERYADLRASLLPQVRAGLEARFRQDRPEPPAWRRLLDPHPPMAVRRQGLASTDDLFRPQFATAVAFGFALTVGALVAVLLGLVLLARPALAAVERGDTLTFCLLIFAPLSLLALFFTAALAPIAWRVTFADVMLGRPPTSGFRPALGAALGATLGIYGSVAGGGFLQGQAFEFDWMRGNAAGRLLPTLFIVALFLGMFGLHFLWLRRTALAWSGRLASRPWGGRAVLPLALLAGLPLAILVPPCLLVALIAIIVSDLAASAGQSALALLPMAGLGVAGSLLFHPLTPLALALAGALPLAAALLPEGAPAAWPVLRRRLPAPPELPLRPLRALAIGALVGIATWLALRAGVLLGPSVADVLTEGWMVVLAVAGMLGLAGLAAAAAPALRAEHGMLAVTAASLAFCAMLPLVGLELDLQSLWFFVSWSFAVGIVTAPAGAALGALAARLRRPRRSLPLQPEA